jgi:hypothetical protein
LEETFQALQKDDLPAARAAFEAYSSEWNGIEVYVNFRSRPLYGEIESTCEADIEKELEEPSAKPAEILPRLQEMIAKYDEAIRLSDTGPPISPLFDDVATIRMVRAPLRTVGPALKSGDTAKAKSRFDAFKAGWGEVQRLFRDRSADAVQDTDTALAQADRHLSAASTNAAEAGPAVDKLLERYNYGLNLVTAAARNADLSRTTFTEPEVTSAAVLGKLQQDLKRSLSAWEAAGYPSAAEVARQAAGPSWENIAPTLQAKGGADAPLKKALDAYSALAGQAGDATVVRAANSAAIEAAAVAQQVLVGQFWTDPAFKAAYAQALG